MCMAPSSVSPQVQLPPANATGGPLAGVPGISQNPTMSKGGRLKVQPSDILKAGLAGAAQGFAQNNSPRPLPQRSPLQFNNFGNQSPSPYSF